ncbi:hypothetical protein Lalb_Chr14g0366331 [Lupinus albus]|uniref:Reverse transcriptase domain-containing protein n=1 Tax=Lupinus albus TaxID=3870 RepID=A0A6A4PCI8_LUPAL|nr:hypothetical protein Lalb_Chr14g0366331 [Lupinus albus]
MSPYMFVLLGQWLPLKLSRGGSSVSHLLFVDDVLLFCKASKSQVRVISNILDDF